VLEDGQVTPLGAASSTQVDVRIVAATHVDLDARVAAGEFRQDLYYRIARYAVPVPPLRDRREDIPLLAQHFLQMFADEMGLAVPSLMGPALKALKEGDFPGNIRQLKNTVERALIESRGQDIGLQHLSLPAAAPPSLDVQLEDLPMNYQEAEKFLLQRALDQTAGNVTAAARLLGVDRFKIYRMLKKLEG